MCSPAYDVDANGKIVPRPLVPDIGPVEADPNDIDDFVDAEPPVAVQPDVREDRGAAPPDDDVHEPAPTHIAMYSVQNLVSTDRAVGGLGGWRFGRLAVGGLGGWRLAVWAVGGWRFGRLAVWAVWRLAVWAVGGWRFGRLVVWAVGGLGGWRFGRFAWFAVLADFAVCVWWFAFGGLRLAV